MNTKHKVLMQFPAFSSRNWEKLTPEQQAVVSEGAAVAMAAYTKNVMEQEASLQETIEAEGVVFTEPDRASFRDAVQQKFLGSELAEKWEDGMFETIANMEIPAECQALSN